MRHHEPMKLSDPDWISILGYEIKRGTGRPSAVVGA